MEDQNELIFTSRRPNALIRNLSVGKNKESGVRHSARKKSVDTPMSSVEKHKESGVRQSERKKSAVIPTSRNKESGVRHSARRKSADTHTSRVENDDQNSDRQCARRKNVRKPMSRPSTNKRHVTSTTAPCKRRKGIKDKAIEKDVDRDKDEDDSDLDDSLIKMPHLKTRMSPRNLVLLINNLSPLQRRSFDTTPFKHMLDLQVTKIPYCLAHFVVSAYNFRSHEVTLANGQSFRIVKEDVHNVLGLPMGPIRMSGSPNIPRDEINVALGQWLEQFGADATGNVVKLGVLKKYIEDHGDDGGEMFKRNIILYIITKLIYCAGNNHVYLDAFPWLIDINNVNQLDWCQYVIDKLLKARENWSEGLFFCGPLLFLVLHYVDTVVDGERDTKRTFPRIKSWTTKDLKMRQKKSHDRGGFGGGFIDKSGPVNSELKETNEQEDQIRDERGNEEEEEEEEEEQIRDEHENGLSSMLLDYGTSVKKLSIMLREVDEKGRKLLKKIPRNEDIQRVIRESREVFNLPTLDDNFDVNQGDADSNEVCSHGDKNTIISFSQDTFLARPDVLAICDAILKTKELKHVTTEIEPPSFSLGLTQDFQTHSTSPFRHQEDLAEEVNEASVGNEISQKAVHERRTRQNRLPGKDVRSPYIVRFVDPKTVPNKKQNDIADYLRSSDPKMLVTLFKCGDVIITRDDLCSLVTLNSFVEANVISVYSFILNEKERYRSESSPTRIFFPIDVTSKLIILDDEEESYIAFEKEMDLCFKKWSLFSNPKQVDLFFFPFHASEHFFVACFNLSQQKQRYDFLDNKSEGGASLDKYNNLPTKLQLFFAKWFTSRSSSHEAMIQTLKPTRLQMKWRDQSNDCDCAVYAMRHMETYQGNGLKDWDTGLEKGKFSSLKNLRIKYAYDIVNFSRNEMKAKVLTQAYETKMSTTS